MDPTETTPVVKQKKGIKKLWARWKASRKSQSSSSQPSATTATTAPTESKPDPVPAPPHEPTTQIAPTPEPIKSTEAPKPKELEEPGSQPANMAIFIEVDETDGEKADQLPARLIISTVLGSDKARFDRAKAIFEKYNMTLDAADWYSPSKSNIERIEKKPRMRVRYSCHECNSPFGRDKNCLQCSHQRCTTCVRYPPKRVGDKAIQAVKKIEEAAADIVADPPTTGACHECKTSFDIGAPECGNCNHKICERCLKETVIASPATAPAPAPIATVAAAS